MSNNLAYSIPDAANVSGVGRTTLYSEIATGRLRAVKQGRRTLILADDLRSWIANLKAVAPKQVA